MDKENIKKGNFLREVRTANSLSEEDLAKIAEVSPEDIAVWENGIKFPEDPVILDKLAKALNVTKRELSNGEFKKIREEDIIEVQFDEDKEETKNKNVQLDNKTKNILLVVLSCMVFFILVGTVISITTGNTSSKTSGPKEVIEVSDEREPVEHHPHTSNEHIIYQTQPLSPNDAAHYDGSPLLNYGFKKVGEKYVKKTSKYKIEYLNSVFTLNLYSKSGTIVAVRDARESLIKYKDSNRAKTVIVQMATPHGKLNCDTDLCVASSDYYKYLNLLVSAVRG
jgi:transcriptional regulator with XRE-family HTH domain